MSGFLPSMGSADGSAELLQVVAEYALQLPAAQINCILRLKDIARRLATVDQAMGNRLMNIIDEWIGYKKYNNTGQFVLSALQSHSLGTFIKRGLIDVNVQKK